MVRSLLQDVALFSQYDNRRLRDCRTYVNSVISGRLFALTGSCGIVTYFANIVSRPTYVRDKFLDLQKKDRLSGSPNVHADL